MSVSTFVGIEGGASVSKSVLIHEDGRVLAEAEGLSLNHHLLGLDVVFKRIIEHVEKLKRSAEGEVFKIVSIGLCLSGCEGEASNQKFEEDFTKAYPGLFGKVSVASDAVGPIAACAPAGGVVLIAGTGSNCVAFEGLTATASGGSFRKDGGCVARCGGWGHMLGESGSGYAIARRAVETILDHDDGLRSCEHDVEPLRVIVYEFFGVDSNVALLPHFYANFDKSLVARLAARVADAARAGDPLCADLFRRTARDLAAHVRAVWKALPAALVSRFADGLPIVCVGSLFRSWDLMQEAFVDALTQPVAVAAGMPDCRASDNGVADRHRGEVSCPPMSPASVERFVCLRPATDAMAAIGAAVYGASLAGVSTSVDFSKNCTVLYQHKR